MSLNSEEKNTAYEKLTPQRKQLVDKVMKNLEKGNLFWTQGWVSSGAPESAITGKKYRGINNLFLSLIAMSENYGDNRSGAFVFAAIMGLLAVVMFMPTQDGIFYSCILENIKFLFAKKVYTENADKQKERVDALLDLKDIKENGLIEYSGGYFGRVIKVGQKNFGIEDVVSFLAKKLSIYIIRGGAGNAAKKS